jgi:hypothetical protein
MTRQILVGVALAMFTIPRPGLAQEAGQWSTWPPRAFLLKSLVEGIEPILKSQNLPTGRFGTQPWICLDQNVLRHRLPHRRGGVVAVLCALHVSLSVADVGVADWLLAWRSRPSRSRPGSGEARGDNNTGSRCQDMRGGWPGWTEK